MTLILLTTLRDQAEVFAYGLPENTVGNYQLLKGALNQRFGHTALRRVISPRKRYEGNKTKRHSGILAKLYKTCIDVLIRRTENMCWKAQ